MQWIELRHWHRPWPGWWEPRGREAALARTPHARATRDAGRRRAVPALGGCVAAAADRDGAAAAAQPLLRIGWRAPARVGARLGRRFLFTACLPTRPGLGRRLAGSASRSSSRQAWRVVRAVASSTRSSCAWLGSAWCSCSAHRWFTHGPLSSRSLPRPVAAAHPLGLADPLVADRFGLWGWTGCSASEASHPVLAQLSGGDPIRSRAIRGRRMWVLSSAALYVPSCRRAYVARARRGAEPAPEGAPDAWLASAPRSLVIVSCLSHAPAADGAAQRCRAELALGVALLRVGAIGYPIGLLSVLRHARARRPALFALSHLVTGVGSAAVFVFTRSVFRPDAGWRGLVRLPPSRSRSRPVRCGPRDPGDPAQFAVPIRFSLRQPSRPSLRVDRRRGAALSRAPGASPRAGPGRGQVVNRFLLWAIAGSAPHGLLHHERRHLRRRAALGRPVARGGGLAAGRRALHGAAFTPPRAYLAWVSARRDRSLPSPDARRDRG